MVRRNGFVALGLLLAVTLGPAAAFAKDKITAVMSTHGFVYLPALVADALGYFEQEDLAVSITLTGGELKSLAALIGGGAEVYVGSPATALRARASGTDPLVVGATTTQFASNLVISGAWAKKHGITELSSYRRQAQGAQGRYACHYRSGQRHRFDRQVSFQAGRAQPRPGSDDHRARHG